MMSLHEPLKSSAICGVKVTIIELSELLEFRDSR